MNYKETELFLKTIKDRKVLIVGDVMVDAYVWGKVERISPEAPVPVVTIEKRENRLGGAANVAVNILAMGAVPVLCSVVGQDDAGNNFKNILKEQNMPVEGIVTCEGRTTTVKTRVIGNKHQLLRVDAEVTTSLNRGEEDLLFNATTQLLKKEKPLVVIFEDYDKGVLSESIISRIIIEANKLNVPVTVDPKKNNFFHYKNATLFKPNLKELREGLKTDLESVTVSSLDVLAKKFATEQNIKSLLITLSEKGVYYYSEEKSGIIPAHIRNISDVSGAGDTVISVASLALACGFDIDDVARISNLAGGLVCEKVGVVPIEQEQLLVEVQRLAAV